ncbi:MAG TPA: hypothetical protein VK446_11470 [Methylocystis sp.]|nr:hypothetical protein [Methylocystis sp.]
MRNLYLGLPAFNAYLLAVRTHPTIAAYQHLRAKFKKETPRLWGALVMACFHDQGHLIIQHEIPDPDAEKLAETKYLRDLEEWRAMSHAQRKKFRRPQPPIKPIFKTIAENAGQLPGTTFFSDKPFSKKELDEIALQFRHLVDDLNIDERALSVYRDRAKYDSSERKTRGSLSATTAYMKQVLWQASVLLGRLEENFVKLAEPVRLFRVSQLSTICRWANSKLDNEYAVAGKSIQERDTYGKISTIGLPSEYTIPSMEGLEVFGRIINSND